MYVFIDYFNFPNYFNIQKTGLHDNRNVILPQKYAISK